MILVKYLIINSHGTVNIRERVPGLKGNEVAVKLEMSLPEELFQRPTLKAVLKIPAEAVPKASITTQVTDNVEKLIKEATGLEMHVTVVEHEDDEKKGR